MTAVRYGYIELAYYKSSNDYLMNPLFTVSPRYYNRGIVFATRTTACIPGVVVDTLGFSVAIVLIPGCRKATDTVERCWDQKEIFCGFAFTSVECAGVISRFD